MRQGRVRKKKNRHGKFIGWTIGILLVLILLTGAGWIAFSNGVGMSAEMLF